MEKKQLFIHAGTYKTGTTSLQRFLYDNEDHLLKQGILYPKFGRELATQAHHAILTELIPQENRRPQKTFTNDQITLLKEEFDHEVSESNATKIVLSTETLSSELSPSQWKLMSTLCDGYETFMIVYLRRQDDFLASFYNQLVKCDVRIRESLLEAIEKNPFMPVFDDKFISVTDNYEKMLLNWSNIVGDKCVIVNPYEGNTKKDILTHFLKYLDIELNSEAQKPYSGDNTSIPLTLIKTKRLMNSCVKPDSYPLYLSDITRYADLLNTLRSHEDNTIKPLSPLSPENRKKILNRYEEMNQRIAQRYLGKDNLFEETRIDENAPFDESLSLTTEELTEIISILFFSDTETRNTLTHQQQYLTETRNTLTHQQQCLQQLTHSLSELTSRLEENDKEIERLHNTYRQIAWVRIFNIRKVLSFLKRKARALAIRIKLIKT